MTVSAGLGAGRTQPGVKRRPAPEIFFGLDATLPNQVVEGALVTWLVQGVAVCPDGQIVAVELKVGDEVVSGQFQGFPRFDLNVPIEFLQNRNCVPSGFALCWNGKIPLRDRGIPISIRFVVRRELGLRPSEFKPIGVVAIVPRRARRLRGKPPLIAIAMATYEPELKKFAQQIESIRQQSLTDWHLYISDESHSAAARDMILSIVASDDRITLRFGQRVGFTENFERALRQIDRRARYFAFADQDDVWYPHKLDVLYSAIEKSGASLVYCGMRVVNAERTISYPFFRWRKPHGHSVAELLVANVVTGAALLARTELLQKALPFPKCSGIAHDWWIALIAASSGFIEQVPIVLQDYVQHQSNVIGHSRERDEVGAMQAELERRSINRYCGLLNGNSMLSQDKIDQFALHVIPILMGVWPQLVARATMNATLEFRYSNVSRSDLLSIANLLTFNSVLRAADSRGRSRRKLLELVPWFNAGVSALAWLDRRREIANAIYRSGYSFRLALLSDAKKPKSIATENRAPAPDYVKKLDSAPNRISVLLRTLRMSDALVSAVPSLEIALELFKLGYRIRLVVVDRCLEGCHSHAILIQWWPALRPLFRSVEIENWGFPNRAINLEDSEQLIATDPHTAFIANRLARTRISYVMPDLPVYTQQAAKRLNLHVPHNAFFLHSLQLESFRRRGIGIFSERSTNPNTRFSVVHRQAVQGEVSSEKGRRIAVWIPSNPAMSFMEKVLNRMCFEDQSCICGWKFEFFTLGPSSLLDPALATLRTFEVHERKRMIKFLSRSMIGIGFADMPLGWHCLSAMEVANLRVVAVELGCVDDQQRWSMTHARESAAVNDLISRLLTNIESARGIRTEVLKAEPSRHSNDAGVSIQSMLNLDPVIVHPMK